MASAGDLDLLAAGTAAVYACPVELLEREEALATLIDAHETASRGMGRVVFVTGEPGIGKTSLVTRFVEDLGAGTQRASPGRATTSRSRARSGPLRDLASAARRPGLAEAIAGGAPAHEVQSAARSRSSSSRPDPTVLVLEDVHWADDATFDSITVLGRRIGTLPALLVLTFRAGEVPPGHPLHAAARLRSPAEPLPVPRACAALRGQPSPGSPDADAAEGLRRERGQSRSTSTELLCSAHGKSPSRRRSRTPCSARAARLDPDCAPPRRARIAVVPEPHRRPGCSTRCCRAGPRRPRSRSGGSSSRSTPRFVRFRHELARNAISRELARPRRRAALPHGDRWRRSWPRTPTRQTDRSSRRGTPALEDVVAEPRARRRASRCGHSSRTDRPTLTTAAQSDFVRPASSSGEQCQ